MSVFVRERERDRDGHRAHRHVIVCTAQERDCVYVCVSNTEKQRLCVGVHIKGNYVLVKEGDYLCVCVCSIALII